MTTSDPMPSPVARRQWPVLVALLAVVALAAVNGLLRPDEAAKWPGLMLVPPLLWLGMAAWHRSMSRSLRRRGIESESSVARYFDTVMVLVFALIGLPLLVRTGVELWLVGGHPADPEIALRFLGAAVSLVFIGVGNALPKILTPLALLPLARAELVTSARRFVGTALVVLGLAMLFAFVAAPLAVATALVRWGTVAGLGVLLGAVVWMNVRAGGLEG